MNPSDEYSKLTDEEVVKLALDNQNVFACLMSRYENKLKRYIQRISNYSPEDINDLLQDIFIKVYKNLNGFDQDLKFSSWIYRIAHNELISSYRKKKRRPEYFPGEENDLALNNIIVDNDIAKEVDSKVTKENILKVINKIDEKYKEVLILKYFEDKDYKEISDILKKPIGTVSTLINRAKKEFRKELEKSKIIIKI